METSSVGFPNWGQRTLVFNSGSSGTTGHVGANGFLTIWDSGQAREMNWTLLINNVNAMMYNSEQVGYRNNIGTPLLPVKQGDTWKIVWTSYSGSSIQMYYIPCF